MKSFVNKAALSLLLIMLTAASAHATLMTLTDCDADGCQGSDVFLDVTPDGSGNYNVILGLDSTGYTGTKTGVIQAGFKAIEGADDITLVSFSDGSWSDATFSAISSNSLCSGPGSPDFGCTSGYANIETNDVYTWNFFVEGGTLLDEWSIKFQYGNATGVNHGQLISTSGEPGNPVPEPSAALVFVVGLLVASPVLRRR